MFTNLMSRDPRRPRIADPGTVQHLFLDTLASSYLGTKWPNPTEIRTAEQVGSGRGGLVK